MHNPYTGSCLCGAIQFEIAAFQSGVAHCHCSMCRKFHGAAHATFASVASRDFHWRQGEELLQAYTADNGTTRKFCSHCGSSLIFSSPQAPPDIIEIALGCIDGEPDIKPDAHIFVASKAGWSVICDGLPQYSDGRDSEKIG